jgi:hypothetical protein
MRTLAWLPNWQLASFAALPHPLGLDANMAGTTATPRRNRPETFVDTSVWYGHTRSGDGFS